MRRAVVSSAATAAGIVLLLSLKPHEGAGAAAVISSGGTGGATDTSSGSSGSSSGSSSGTSGSTGSTRTVTGDAANTRYGPVQVKVTLDGSRITTIDVVQYPSNDHRDQEINSYALPLLNQEAIAAQSAQIDVVSGATFTSDGYTRSLQSALDKAGR
ncbi:FMN-binding protein [Streptomyces sp. NRRL B-24484]|uniref:FMN-binding protein n=1 Tax=Streptomyces sp. NRRL B-24484 TaxID=1463833 RepID=UPI0004C10BA7|nr:FMN-binding protein [Streptomyces sp. NRRL B-24484]